MFSWRLPQTPLRTLRLGKILYIFLSQRRQDRQEHLCLICSYPKLLCRLCVMARVNCTFLSLRRGERRVCDIFFPPKNTSALPAPLRDYVFYFPRKGAKIAKNIFVWFVLTTNTFAYFAPWRELIVFFSRKGAKIAKNNYVWFVLTPNTFAGFAPWREKMSSLFDLAKLGCTDKIP